MTERIREWNKILELIKDEEFGGPLLFTHSSFLFSLYLLHFNNLHMRKIIFLLFTFIYFDAGAQKSAERKTATDPDSVLFSKMKYRLVGPFRGGRSGAVAGSYTNKNTFYFGATGGGVWKTTDAGSNWKNISDKYYGGT